MTYSWNFKNPTRKGSLGVVQENQNLGNVINVEH